MLKNATTEKIITLILSVGRTIRKQVCEEEGSCRLSILQIETLRYIRENKKVLMKDLADYLHIAPPSATSIVDDLFRQKFVKRSDDRKDRRITKVSLTAKGKRTLESSLKRKLERFRKKIDILSPAEKKSLLKILEKIADNQSI